jgi:antitoxin component of MazEF toxin-antitoxin module
MKSVTTTQKIIKVGSSGAVTIPAKVMKQFGAVYGDNIEVEFRPVVQMPSDDKVELVTLTQKLIKRHEQALKNLSQR